MLLPMSSGCAPTGALLLCSISDAMARSQSNAAASQQWTSARPANVKFCEGPKNFACHSLAPLSQPLPASASLLGASFEVQPRRHAQLPKQVQHFLVPGPDNNPAQHARRLATALQAQILARAPFLAAIHSAVSQHVENHWRPISRLQAMVRLLRPGTGGERGEGGRWRRDAANEPVDPHALKARGPRAAVRLAEQALAKEHAMLLVESADLFERAAKLCDDAGDGLAASEYWSRASKQWSDMTYVPGVDEPTAMQVNLRAIELGKRAVLSDPDQAFGHVALCVSRGRLAIFTKDARAKVALARLAQDDVATALKLEPTNDLAHHLLGRWHYEMASVNAVVRTIVHLLYGQALMAGNYPQALKCFQEASRLAPSKAIHAVEQGRLFMKLNQRAAAEVVLRRSLELPYDDINGYLTQGDARGMLVKMGLPITLAGAAADGPASAEQAKLAIPRLPPLDTIPWAGPAPVAAPTQAAAGGK